MPSVQGELCESAERYRQFPAESVQEKSGYQGHEKLLTPCCCQPLMDLQRERQGLRGPE